MTARSILVIVLDDFGRELLRPDLTPNLLRLAAEGTSFVNAYSMGLCVPSRATLLTGRYPWEHGLAGHLNYDDYPDGPGLHDTGLPTWLSSLSDADIRTMCAGKWQFRDPLDPNRMHDLGLDEWLVWSARGPGVGDRYSGSRLWSDDPELDGILPAWSEDVFAGWLIERMLEAARFGERFAAYYPLHLPHQPIVRPPGQPDASLESMVRDADRRIGALAEMIATTPLRKDTLVLITSDNGTDRDGAPGKGHLTDAGVNVPLFTCGAGAVPGAVDERMIDFSDFAPTICDLMGLDAGHSYKWAGHSFADRLGASASTAPRATALSSGLGILRPDEDGLFRVNPEARAVGAYRGRYAIVRDWHGDRLYDRRTGEAPENGTSAAEKLRAELDAVPEDRALGPVGSGAP